MLSTDYISDEEQNDVTTDHANVVLLEVSKFPSKELEHQDSIHPVKSFIETIAFLFKIEKQH